MAARVADPAAQPRVDGRYLIVYRVNTLGHVRESSTADNTAVTCVRFHGTVVHTCPLPAAAERLSRASVAALRSHHRLSGTRTPR